MHVHNSRVAQRLESFRSNVFAEMTAFAEANRAINLGQGLPGLNGPDVLLRHAASAIEGGDNQYTLSEGARELRKEISAKARLRGLDYDPENEITVTSGATESIFCALFSILNPEDEVICLEPYYDYYPGLVTMAGGKCVSVPLRLEGDRFCLDIALIEERITSHTKAIIINTPHNPTGTVFGKHALESIADVALTHNLLVISDEVYEDMVYDGPHLSLAGIGRMKERTIICSSASKSFSITGWRVGWALAPQDFTAAIRNIHRFLSFCAPAPLQRSVAEALSWARQSDYYERLRDAYLVRRDLLYRDLSSAGLMPIIPSGTFYMICRTDVWNPDLSSSEFCRRLAVNAKVVALPLETFYHHQADALGKIRFAFSKDLDALQEAGKRLIDYAQKGHRFQTGLGGLERG